MGFSAIPLQLAGGKPLHHRPDGPGPDRCRFTRRALCAHGHKQKRRACGTIQVRLARVGNRKPLPEAVPHGSPALRNIRSISRLAKQ